MKQLFRQNGRQGLLIGALLLAWGSYSAVSKSALILIFDACLRRAGIPGRVWLGSLLGMAGIVVTMTGGSLGSWGEFRSHSAIIYGFMCWGIVRCRPRQQCLF